MTPALLLAAHGSRDPRFAATVTRIRDAVAARLSTVDVAVAFLDLDEPTVADELRRVSGPVVVVPLLLSDAFHSRVDLPGIIDGARRAGATATVAQSDTLGDPALETVVTGRLHELGLRPGDGVVLCAVGSSDAAADARIVDRSHALAAMLPGLPVTVAFATRLAGVTAAVHELHALDVDRVVVAPFFVSAGTLTDRVERHLDALGIHWAMAGPMGAHPDLVSIVCDRYRATAPAVIVG